MLWERPAWHQHFRKTRRSTRQTRVKGTHVLSMIIKATSPVYINHHRRPCPSLLITHFLQFCPKRRLLKGWLWFIFEKYMSGCYARPRSRTKTTSWTSPTFSWNIRNSWVSDAWTKPGVDYAMNTRAFVAAGLYKPRLSATQSPSFLRSINPKTYLKCTCTSSMAVFSSPKQFLETGMTRTWKLWSKRDDESVYVAGDPQKLRRVYDVLKSCYLAYMSTWCSFCPRRRI